MKKLLKYEWKFYGGAVLLVIFVLTGYNFRVNEWNFYEYNFYQFSYDVTYILRSACHVNTENIIITAIAYCILKLYKYWIERNSYGREFLATLPIKKRTVELFYLLADCVFVLLPNIVYWIISFVYANNMIAAYHIEVPWLFTAMLSVLIITAAYLLMLLAAFHFVESLIVNGIWKIFGAVAAIFMLSGILIMGASVLSEERDTYAKISDYVWDFLLINERADMYRSDYDEKREQEFFEKYDNIYAVTNDTNSQNADMELEDLYNGEYGTDAEIYYDGEPIDKVFYEMAEGKFLDDSEKAYYTKADMLRMAAWTWMEFDWNMEGFEKYEEIPEPEVVWGNFLLAVILFVLAILLAGKKEAASQIFYFSFVKYMYALLFGITIFYIGIVGAEALWHKALVILSSVCTAVLCVRWMTPEYSARLGKRLKKKV